jgi:hypothetical protein
MMKTNDQQFDEALKNLARSLRTVEGTEARPIARRHARQRVLKELRRVRALLDEKAPAIVQRGKITRRTPQQRIKLLERTGWSEVDVARAARFAAAGVRIKRIAWTVQTETYRSNTYINGKGWVKHSPIISKHGVERLFVPGWAGAIGHDQTKLRAAKKDPLLRKSVVATKLLQESV